MANDETESFTRAFKHLTRGMILFSMFFVLIWSPKVGALWTAYSMEYDSDASSEENQEPMTSTVCTPFTDEYDERACFYEYRDTLIRAGVVDVLFHAIPVVGSVEVLIGLFMLSNIFSERQLSRNPSRNNMNTRQPISQSTPTQFLILDDEQEMRRSSAENDDDDTILKILLYILLIFMVGVNLVVWQ